MSNEKIETVVRKVRALQALTVQTGTITRRSQSLLLQSLTTAELAEAALLLNEQTEQTEQTEGEPNAAHPKR